ncbi:hypothetical protein [Pseudomonas protegens]|uniref:hypothetical protein n=1 Tax=Pseudomonas protegens TaxID=380021 RepID=UPI0011AF0EA8|nr:hypothetical protein [Pseudomonas protegens]
MIPQFVRVAAIDNEQDHLNQIYSALASAGYWVMPFLYDFGGITPSPSKPFNGVRIVFTDIHLFEGGMNNMAQHALAIMQSLKKIVCDGPYAIIFWTKHPDDAEAVFRDITARAEDLDLVLPVGYGCINKDLVLALEEKPDRLPELIEQINTAILNCGALLLSISWEERVSQAAIRSTHRLYELTKQPDNAGSLARWHKLLAFLSTQAVGSAQAALSPVAAMDAALLPILEDRLDLSAEHVAPLDEFLAREFGNRPEQISGSSLNTHYLVSNLQNSVGTSPAGRGVVSRIDRTSWDQNCPELWGASCSQVLASEFLWPTTKPDSQEFLDSLVPCVVTLTPECDDVQGKVYSYRYLLGVFVPFTKDSKARYFSTSKSKYSNLSIFEVGVISLDLDGVLKDYCLLVSCNRFFAKPTRDLLHVKPTLRLRRATLEELSHHYTTHARRPGVMRFFV